MDNRNHKLKVPWISDIQDPIERENFTQQVLASKKVLDKVHKIVYNKVLDGEKVKVADYDNPSWSHWQADRNGYLRGLREILDLLNFGDHDQ